MLLLLSVATLLLSVDARVTALQQPQLRILAVPLLPTSPTMDMMAVLAELKARGHEVLVVAASAHLDFFKQAAARHSSNSTAEALRYLSVDLAAAAKARRLTGGRPVKPGQVTQSRFAVPHFPRTLTAGLELELVIQDVVAEPCALLLEDGATFKAMQDFHADVVTAIGMPVPDTGPDSCGCVLSHALGIPMVDIDCGMTFWSGPPSVPQFGSGLQPSDLSSPAGFTQNFAAWLIKAASMPLLTGLRQTPWSAVRDRLGLPRTSSGCPLVDGITRLRGYRVEKCDVLLNAVMGSWLLEYPRPLAANQVLLGPGSPRPPHTIEQPQVAAFVEGATAGLVLVAFGTSFQFNSWLSLVDYQELSAAFASLAPVRVLWHINTQVLPPNVDADKLPLGSNTLLVPQVDYNDVLGHTNARVFVSHCGLHSIYEAAYHGVPVVGVPFMFEQAESGSKLAAAGAAVMCREAPAYRSGRTSHVHYSREHVAGLIQQVMQDDSYQRAAERLAVVLQTQARQRHPYAAAADEFELAVNSRLLVVNGQGKNQRQEPRAAQTEL